MLIITFPTLAIHLHIENLRKYGPKRDHLSTKTKTMQCRQVEDLRRPLDPQIDEAKGKGDGMGSLAK